MNIDWLMIDWSIRWWCRLTLRVCLLHSDL